MTVTALKQYLSIMLLAALSACGGGGGGGGGGSEGGTGQTPLAVPSSPPDTIGTVFGRVLDSRTEAPLAGARVTAAGRSTTTGTDGSFLLDNLALSRVVVTATAAGCAEQTTVAETRAGNCGTGSSSPRPRPRWCAP